MSVLSHQFSKRKGMGKYIWFLPRHFNFIKVKQARKVSDHVYVCLWYRFGLCFFDFSIELLWSCSNIVACLCVIYDTIFCQIKFFMSFQNELQK